VVHKEYQDQVAHKDRREIKVHQGRQGQVVHKVHKEIKALAAQVVLKG
jgi:hypothetical protein